MANEKQENEKQEKNELRRDEYWALTSDFTQIVNRAKEGYQEKSPGREIDFVNLFMGSRSGIICKADERGIPQVRKLTIKVRRGPKGSLLDFNPE